MTYDEMLDKLRKGENFSFSRYGDGEWQCILGYDGGNCDGHRYFPSLGKALGDVLRDKPAYTVGMQPKTIRDMGLDVARFCAMHGLPPPELWPNADILHDKSMDDGLDEFLDACRSRNILLVGPKHIKLFGMAPHVVIPPKNCWLVKDHILGQVVGNLLIIEDDPLCDHQPLVLWCAGMAAKVMIHDIYRMFGNSVSQLDVGSALDPYCGVSSRRYHESIIVREQNKNGAGCPHRMR